MNMKSQIAIAGLLFAGLLASGCSQQQAAGEQSTGSAQQTAADVVTPAAEKVAPATRVVTPVVPRVKAKGNYKGPVAQDAAAATAMQRYKK